MCSLWTKRSFKVCDNLVQCCNISQYLSKGKFINELLCYAASKDIASFKRMGRSVFRWNIHRLGYEDLESNVPPQLELMHSGFWNSSSVLDLCHACKVLFCKSCVDTTNCWVNSWEQSFMLRENGWLLQCKLMKRKKTGQHDKRFFIVRPLTYSWIPAVTFHLLTCMS